MSLKVEDVMVKDIITIGAEATVEKAVEIMNKYNIGCLIVAEGRRPIGIVTERDMLKRVLLQKKNPKKIIVDDVMSRPLIVSAPKTAIHNAVRVMNERNIKKLPVVKDGDLQGLVSLTDVVRSLAYFEHAISSLCARCQFRKRSTDPSNLPKLHNSDHPHSS
ncbi:MAG: CBS domain-containing protein [Candidatus Bathyarchaeota archaeon]|nr:MAG: CBS domain-containing protein [Candidatus Bathyarchaeota archaeon]